MLGDLSIRVSFRLLNTESAEILFCHSEIFRNDKTMRILAK